MKVIFVACWIPADGARLRVMINQLKEKTRRIPAQEMPFEATREGVE